MIIGIAYHSPLDIVSLLPLNVKYSTNKDDVVDILISNKIVREYKAKIQLVFISARELIRENLPILDHGPWGKILMLTSEQIEDLLNKQYKLDPDWINFKV